MVTLRFIARENAVATVPGSRANIGQAAFYVGRKYVPPDREKGKGATYVATEEPHEVSLDLDREDDKARFYRYQKLAKRGDIWAADEKTAKACDVEFVPATFANGEWTRTVVAPRPPGEAPPPSAHQATMGIASEPAFDVVPDIPIDTSVVPAATNADVDIATKGAGENVSNASGEVQAPTPFGLPQNPPQDVLADPFADIAIPRDKPTKKRPQGV